MHFTEPVYRNPYWPTWPLLEITRGCTHNKCKFCTMYKGVKFGVAPMQDIEQDLRELAATVPDARTIQLLSANPLALPYDKMAPILEKINEYLPQMEHVYTAGRVTDVRNKTVDQLRALRDLGLNEVSLGVESGDDWTLARIDKGYASADILEQCRKLEEAGIDYWMTFLNGVAGREHSRDHAVNSAKVFSQCKPIRHHDDRRRDRRAHGGELPRPLVGLHDAQHLRGRRPRREAAGRRQDRGLLRHRHGRHLRRQPAKCACFAAADSGRHLYHRAVGGDAGPS
ncbi:MAG TPA: hypothetical protein DCP91_13310 [Eggerthellaceae bacterium]|nr:hypothetical protein [Eggerthellaceae bacterium]